jgi:hypothetical protein
MIEGWIGGRGRVSHHFNSLMFVMILIGLELVVVMVVVSDIFLLTPVVEI